MAHIYFFVITYKNFGTVPATDVRISINAIIDGVRYATAGDNGIYDRHESVFPQSQKFIKYKHGHKYAEILKGNVVYDLEVIIKYKGITKDNDDNYEDYEKWRYDSAHKNLTPIEAHAR